MTKKILELTEKIYNEGVEKAKKEAEVILSNANKEAENIINTAKNKEKELLEQARQKAAEVTKNTHAELKLAAQQFISNLKQQITQLITTAQVETPMKEAFKNEKFVQEMLLTLIKNWNPQKPEELNINLLLPEAEKEKFVAFFEGKAKEHLNAGVEIKFDQHLKNGFKIGPKDGSYVISFTDKDFENYFKNYLKERTRTMIF